MPFEQDDLDHLDEPDDISSSSCVPDDDMSESGLSSLAVGWADLEDEPSSSSSVAEPDRYYLVCVTSRGIVYSDFETDTELAQAWTDAKQDSAVFEVCAFHGHRIVPEIQQVIRVSMRGVGGSLISSIDL